jgi:hypothetical protein
MGGPVVNCPIVVPPARPASLISSSGPPVADEQIAAVVVNRPELPMCEIHVPG